MDEIDEHDLSLNSLIANLQASPLEQILFNRTDILSVCQYVEALRAQNRGLIKIIEDIAG